MKTTLTLVAVTALMLAAVAACGKKEPRTDRPSRQCLAQGPRSVVRSRA